VPFNFNSTTDSKNITVPASFNESNWYINFLCESTIAGKSDEAEFNRAFLSNYDINKKVVDSTGIYPSDPLSPLNVDLSYTSVYDSFILLNNDSPNIDSLFQSSCVGRRDLSFDDATFKNLYYNGIFTFRAGWKLFDSSKKIWAESN
jgi:hypothetical protein